MSAGLGDLVISLSADLARFESDMGRAAAIAQKQANAIQGSFTLMKAAVGVIAASAVTDYVKGLVDAAEATNRLAERTGYAVGFLSEVGFAMSRGNVPTDVWAKALERFNVSLVDGTASSSKASQIFKRLGVDITQGPTEALKQFAVGASAIDDAATKTAVFRFMMGKTGDELIPVFKNLGEATAAAKRLGVTMSDETAQNAEKLNTALASLGAQGKALTLEMLTPMISAFATMATNIELASEKGEKWTQVMREGMKLGLSLLGGFGIQDDRMARGFAALSPQSSIFDQTVANFTGNKPTVKPPPNSKGLNSVLSGDATKQAAELKQYQSALQGLEEKLGKLNGQSEVEALLTKLVDGSLQGLTVTHQRHLMQIAYEVDARKFLLDGMADEETRRTAALAIMQRGLDIQRSAELAYADDLTQRQFDLDLIGKSALEQTRLNAVRTIDLQLTRDLRAAAANAGSDWVQYAKDYEALTEAAKTHTEAVLASMDQTREKQRSWVTGADQAFDDYLDHATNAAEQTKTLFTAAFTTLEDMELDFITKSGANWKSMADNFINQVIRMELQAQNAKIFAGITSAGGISGLAGQAGLMMSGNSDKAMNAILDMGFPSYDVGSDYVPRTGLAVVHQGEKITPASQNGGGSPSMVVNPSFNVFVPDTRSFAQWLGTRESRQMITGVFNDAMRNAGRVSRLPVGG